MVSSITLQTICAPSDDIVAREIEDEIIIVPLASGIGDTEDELYSLNPTGQAIWKHLDGARSLDAVVDALAMEFNAPRAELETDVLGFCNEMVTRGILVVR
ncbi:MAG: PqqD family protein [Anaerolineales bacterium]|nr:PqqD family protein [Anaerolineales bacterium]